MGIKTLLFKTQKHVENLYKGYLTEWKTCNENFNKAMEIYIEKGITEEFGFWVQSTHKKESLADDLRRKIEFELYSRSLLPESRGDILGLLESIDKILNKMESVLYQIFLEKIVMPEFLRDSIKSITDITDKCMKYVYDASIIIFEKQEEILKLADKIDEKESECDYIERDALTSIFNSDIEWYQKFQLKDLIIQLGNITDRAETVADRLTIISVKRRV